jgi:hypothetical protein
MHRSEREETQERQLVTFFPRVPGLVSQKASAKEKLEVVSQEFASMEQLMMAMQLEVGSQEFASMESLIGIQLNLCPNPLAIIVESGRHIKTRKTKDMRQAFLATFCSRMILMERERERERENTCWVCIPVHIVLLNDVFD